MRRVGSPIPRLFGQDGEVVEIPFLASLMRAQATYEEAYAARVPNYQPSEDDLWQAASTFNDSVGAVCQTTAPH